MFDSVDYTHSLSINELQNDKPHRPLIDDFLENDRTPEHAPALIVFPDQYGSWCICPSFWCKPESFNGPEFQIL